MAGKPWRSRRGRRRPPLPGRKYDRLDNPIQIVADIPRRNSQRFDAAFSQPQVAPGVVSRLIANAVVIAIDLHRQGGGGAIEVEDIGAHRVLPAKSQTVLSLAAQHNPEMDLRRRHIPSQPLGPRDGEPGRFHGAMLAHCNRVWQS